MSDNPLQDRLIQALRDLEDPEAPKDFPEFPKDWSSLSKEEREAYAERINDFFDARQLASIEARYDGKNPTPEERKKVEIFLALFRMVRDKEKRKEEDEEERQKLRADPNNPATNIARRFRAQATVAPAPPPQAPAAIRPVPPKINAAPAPATTKHKRKMLTFWVDESVVKKMRHVVYWYEANNQQNLLEQMLLQYIEEMEKEQKKR